MRRASFSRASLLAALLFLLVAPFVVAAKAAVNSASDEPFLVMDKTKRDFGDVFAGEELFQIFHVRNAGTKPLELSQKPTLTGGLTTRYSLTPVIWTSTTRALTRRVAGRASPT